MIHQFAAVNFAKRSADGVLAGYQRATVSSHIAQIKRYLSQPEALLPNAIVIAFGGSVKFAPLPGAVRSSWGTPGKLEVPLPGPREAKPGFIVDGQQRVTALSQLPPSRRFPVVVVSFAAESPDLQLEQFVLVNKTRPLPRDLINELLPHVESDKLPRAWQSRQIAADVLEHLRFEVHSPFHGRVRGVGSTAEGCNIGQAALLSIIASSIRRGGVLARTAVEAPHAERSARMARVVSVFFSGAARVWPEAWDGSPWTSRLVHGVGIAGLGSLMDVVMDEVDAERPRAVTSVARRLGRIQGRCAWTGGRWPDPLDCEWDALQNTSQDKRRLAAFLVTEYAHAR